MASGAFLPLQEGGKRECNRAYAMESEPVMQETLRFALDDDRMSNL